MTYHLIVTSGKDEGKTLIMESVDIIEPEGEGLRLQNIFGEQKFIKGHIHSLSLVDHKVYIQQYSD